MVSVFEVRLAAQLAKQKSENGTASTASKSNGDYHIENEVPKIGRKGTIFQSIVRRHRQRQNGGRGVNRKRRNTSSFRNIVAFQSLVKRVTVQNKSEFLSYSYRSQASWAPSFLLCCDRSLS